MLPRIRETLLRQPQCIPHSRTRTASQTQTMCIYHASNWSMAIVTHHRLRKVSWKARLHLKSVNSHGKFINNQRNKVLFCFVVPLETLTASSANASLLLWCAPLVALSRFRQEMRRLSSLSWVTYYCEIQVLAGSEITWCIKGLRLILEI